MPLIPVSMPKAGVRRDSPSIRTNTGDITAIQAPTINKDTLYKIQGSSITAHGNKIKPTMQLKPILFLSLNERVGICVYIYHDEKLVKIAICFLSLKVVFQTLRVFLKLIKNEESS